MTTIHENTTDQAEEMATQNDDFRRKACAGDLAALSLGRLMLTRGIVAMGSEVVSELLDLVGRFSGFDEGNDPYHEHDFGSIGFLRERILWKIDYYDLNYKYGSEARADPMATRRVLTVMLAEEY